MATIQTKINFVEKKKTSARLKNKFNRGKEVVCKSTSRDEPDDICTSPLKITSDIKFNCILRSPLKSCEYLENKEKVPRVLLYRSPLKVKETWTENVGNECHDKENKEDILEFNNCKESPPVCKFSINSNKTKLINKDHEIKELLQSSPIKKTQSSPRKYESPCKKREINTNGVSEERYLLRSSPKKRIANSPSKQESKEEGASPPKRECTLETPSQLITNLFLDSPERDQKPVFRKELFPKGEFDEASKALHSSAPTTLPGREEKLTFLKSYLLKHSKEEKSGTLYISGPPGTGKTACVNIAVTDPQISEAFRVVCLNCTALKSCGSVYSRIVGELKLKPLGHSEKANLSAIEKHLRSNKRKMILIVLDELDQLCSSKQSILYSVFEWPARPDARLVLIGIANALDLTDRVLPRLQSRLSQPPTELHFPSYTREQIVNIITDRLHQAGVEKVFSAPTLQLLAGKVAAVNGDVRRALDIARRVVEVAERRTKLHSLPDHGPASQTVALQEVMSVVNDVYSTSQTLDSAEAESFPLQQKLLICSLLIIRQRSKAKDVTIGKLHDVYKKVCERRNVSALDVSEFISLTSLVEARGILKISGKGHNRLSKVVLQWDENEVKSTLQDKKLLAEVLIDKTIM